MKINVKLFKEFVDKATLNYLIQSVQVNITKDFVWSQMKKGNSCFTNIKLKNEIVSDLSDSDSYQLNFFEPLQDLKPFIDLIDEELVDIKVFETYIKLNKQFKIVLEDPSIIEIFDKGNIKFENFDKVCGFKFDELFIPKWEKIAKIGNKFGKIYFTNEDNKFYIETTDKTNEFTNSVKLELFDNNFDDMHLCFDFMSFVKLINVIDENYADFTVEVYYTAKLKMGFIYCYNKDKSEQYTISSISE